MEVVDLTDDMLCIQRPVKKQRRDNQYKVSTLNNSTQLTDWISQIYTSFNNMSFSFETDEEIHLFRSILSITRRKIKSHESFGSFTTEKQLQRILRYLRRMMSGYPTSMADTITNLGLSSTLLKESSDKQSNDQLTVCGDDHMECSICLSMLADPVITPCNHLFCLECIHACIKDNQIQCPNCRNPFPDKELKSVTLSNTTDMTTSGMITSKFIHIFNDAEKQYSHGSSLCFVIISLFNDFSLDSFTESVRKCHKDTGTSLQLSFLDSTKCNENLMLSSQNIYMINLSKGSSFNVNPSTKHIHVYVLDSLLTSSEYTNLHGFLESFKRQHISVTGTVSTIWDSFEEVVSKPEFIQPITSSITSRNYRSIISSISSCSSKSI